VTRPDASTSDRTVLRRHPERGSSDAASIVAVLDEALVVHVAAATERGPLVLPMAFARKGTTLYLHGAAKNGLFAALVASGEVCVCATLLDGMILAKSAFHHSMNYRSVVVFAEPRVVEDGDEKRLALDAIVEHALPGRANESRRASDGELTATLVLAVDLTTASAKTRTGPAIDASPDLPLPYWAGVLPTRLAAEPALPGTSAGSIPESAVAFALAHAPRLGGEQRIGDIVIDSDPRRIDVDRVVGWLADESYWATDMTRERFADSVAGAFLVGAYTDKGEQVGFARVVTDAITMAWLGDVFVAASHRDRGIGKALVSFCLDHPRLVGVRKWLLGTRDAHELYRRHGFTDIPLGRFMVRP